MKNNPDGTVTLTLTTPLGNTEIQFQKSESRGDAESNFTKFHGEDLLGNIKWITLIILKFLLTLLTQISDKLVDDIFSKYDRDSDGNISFKGIFRLV